jgi:hypothetical protein
MNHTRPIRQFHTLKYIPTGFLVETHHVLFVYLTLQRELLSELLYLRANTCSGENIEPSDPIYVGY